MTAQEILDSNQENEQINEVAEWLESLKFDQILFLKRSYEEMLQAQARACGSEYVQWAPSFLKWTSRSSNPKRRNP